MPSWRPRAVLNMHIFVSCQIDVENKHLFSPLVWNNPLSKIKFHSLISLKRNSTFMKYFFIGQRSGKWSENFPYWHLTLKLLKVLKSRLCFKERWQISRVNNPKTIRIENAQFTRFYLCMSICVKHILF